MNLDLTDHQWTEGERAIYEGAFAIVTYSHRQSGLAGRKSFLEHFRAR